MQRLWFFNNGNASTPLLLFPLHTNAMKTKKTVIVVGGGFAGINFVKKIDKRFFDVILIDKINHHQFQPLFYQVATSQLEPSSVSFPLRHIFRDFPHVRIRLAELLQVFPETSEILTSIGTFNYDYLVLAMGCKTNFFGNQQLAKHAFTLKTTYDAISIRNHILQTFEQIVTCQDEAQRKSLLHMVIVGAGPTGVELAGAFAEIKRDILPRDYPRIDFSELRIILVEGSKHTLNLMSDMAKSASYVYLQKMGVEIRTEYFVKDYDGEILTFSNGETLLTRTLVWAAGVTPNKIEGLPQHCYTTNQRIRVDRYNKLLDSEDLFALGDLAYMETEKYPKGHPQVANVAINQALNLAKNLNRAQQNQAWKPYEYQNLGSMATVGRNKAVVDLPFISFKGFFAWVVWMFLHLMLILSVRNKLIIFINWAWAYITKDTALRLILKDNTGK